MVKNAGTRKLIMAAVFIAGVVLMAFGILQGELTAIMRKAVTICFECIGIG